MLIKTIPFTEDVFNLFFQLKNRPHVFFLDSSLTASVNGRFSFLGCDPFAVWEGHSLEDYNRFKEQFNQFAMPRKASVIPFLGGAVGYLSYDLGALLQGVQIRSRHDANEPLFCFGLYDVVLVMDHLEQNLHICSSGLPQTNEELRKTKAKERLQQTVQLIQSIQPSTRICRRECLKDPCPLPNVQSSVSPAEYIQGVNKALEHIRQGNIYEINLSHRVRVENPKELASVAPWEMYACLRELSPSHFSAFFDAGTHQILSTSPERFLNLKHSLAQIRPMKGTRPRGQTPDEDSAMRQELLHSKKEIAELLMVTDLERNDLGKVCEFGSVRVKELRTIEEYKTVFQATSTIEGRLEKSKSSFDLIEACFPGGSVTGCPKISAMKIIESLEQTSRGLYTGAFGYIDFCGNLDFNILIRTLLIKNSEISFHVGGGIVADSDPQMEYEETWVKAKALMECLSLCPARRGI